MPWATTAEWKVKRFEVRHVWAELAAEMAKLEHPRAAQEYLSEARRHNAAFGDAPNGAYCVEVDATLDALSGRPKDAVAKLLRAQKSLSAAARAVGGGAGFADARAWARTTLALVAQLRVAGDRNEAKRALTEACDAFEARVRARRPELGGDGSLGGEDGGEDGGGAAAALMLVEGTDLDALNTGPEIAVARGAGEALAAGYSADEQWAAVLGTRGFVSGRNRWEVRVEVSATSYLSVDGSFPR